jgi:hypothetical protein
VPLILGKSHKKGPNPMLLGPADLDQATQGI